MATNIVLEDKSNQCLSVIHSTTVEDYLRQIEQTYNDKGGIEGQRAPLKTKTAIRIRERMIEDIKKGALLPPIVIGIVIDKGTYERAKLIHSENLTKFIDELEPNSFSIIDGMQRTTALEQSVKEDPSAKSHSVRVEYWMSCSIGSLIYRMLILNTGQVPWDIKRQLATVYSPILKKIKNEIPDIEILNIDDSSRRTSSGEFQGSKLIEFFLAFSSSKAHLDIKEKVAEDFERMNAVDALSSDDFLNNFILMIRYLKDIDKAFGKIPRSQEDNIEGKFKSGKDIFTSSPAGIGFMSAAATLIYGIPGTKWSIESSQQKLSFITTKLDGFLDNLNSKYSTSLYEFLDLMTINERLNIKTGKVGEHERDFFHKAFKTLMENGEQLDSMTPCWVAL